MSDNGSARRLCGLLADVTRAKVFAAVVLGAHAVPDLATTAGLDAASTAKALRQLETGGLVSISDGTISATLGSLSNAAAGRANDPGADEPDATRAAVLRHFLAEDGSLKEIPATTTKRRVVLEHIAGFFEIGVTYPERMITLRLQGFHPDHAALRRYLIDGGLLERRDGIYWRAGGPVDL